MAALKLLANTPSDFRLHFLGDDDDDDDVDGAAVSLALHMQYK